MSSSPSTRASDVAARQVEQIVAAAQEAAEQIREGARRELQAIRERGEGEVETEMNLARKEAILLTQDARRDAESIIATAEKAAAEVLEEATALSGGLHQLGRSLASQADRILRDVSAAHKQMQADLRIAGGSGGAPDPTPAPVDTATPGKRSAVADERPASEPPTTPRRRRANPFVDLEVPSWER